MLQVKVFKLRLDNENSQSDQDNLNKFLEGVKVKKTSTEVISGQPNFWSILVFFEGLKADNVEKISIKDESELTAQEKRIYSFLKEWRKDKAIQLNVKNYMVCHNQELMSIAKLKPETPEELYKIKGFGQQKVSRFGDDIISVLNAI